MGDTYTGVCKKCERETDLIEGICAECSLFIAEVDKAYDILWKLYAGKDGKGCDFNMEKEQKLLRMINCIDDELGR